jgi:hypothetical protein
MDEVNKQVSKIFKLSKDHLLALHPSIQSLIDPIFNQFNRQDSILSTGGSGAM